VPVEADVGTDLRSETASNAAVETWATSAAPPVVLPRRRRHCRAAITGTSAGPDFADSRVLDDGPTSYSYQWLQCDSLGSGCLPISSAASRLTCRWNRRPAHD